MFKKDFNDLKTNPLNLRNFLFELYIYRLLDQNGIPNVKKPWIGNQPVEGICQVNGKEFLFECRKAFMPDIHRIDLPKRIATDFDTSGRNLPYPKPVICTIKFKMPLTGAHRNHYSQVIKGFFSLFKSVVILSESIDYCIEDKFGTFHAISYDVASLIEVKGKGNYDVLFYSIPAPETIHRDLTTILPKAEYSFSIDQNKVNRKVETILREKKAQHKNSPYRNKIIFMDSETLPEFHMGLFQNENMFDLGAIKNIYDKLRLDSILCISRRSYIGGRAHILCDTFIPKI